MSDSEYSGDWAKARRKINEGKNWRGTANISLGDVTVQLTYRMLEEPEFFELNGRIDHGALAEHRDSIDGEVEDRLLELQDKDDLSPDEEDELEELSEQLQDNKMAIMDSLGTETYNAFIDAGEWAIMPSDGDIEDGFQADPSEQERRFGRIPNTRDEMEQAIKEEMKDVLDGSPYPVRFTLGQQAFMESMKLLGNEKTDE